MLGNMCLQGKSKNPFSLTVSGLVNNIDAWVAEQWAESRVFCLANFFIWKALVLFIMFDVKGAFEAVEKARPLIVYIPANQLNAPFRLLEALTRLQLIAPASTGPCKGRPVQVCEKFKGKHKKLVIYLYLFN